MNAIITISKSMKHCKICKTPLTGKQKCYCSDVCHRKGSNTTFNSYSIQRTRAIQRKIALVIRMGGKCSGCGYKKNLAALHFHHTDPTLKEFKLDRRILSTCSIARMESEAAKCILLCGNCHTEHHYPNENEWWDRLDLNQQPRP